VAPEPEGFPRLLKLLMDAEGLSTRELAAKTGGAVSHSAIAQWLNGTNRATTEQAKHVADALGWDVYELLHGRPAADIIDRLAEMDAALRRVRRALAEATRAAAISGVEVLVPRPATSPAAAAKKSARAR
jgi:transcriptional regulator with XRE-family HTH domain